MASRAYTSAAASAADDYEVRGAGWLGFAAIMLGLAGTWNFVDGLLAIGHSKVFVANSAYIFSDLRTWGWITLVLGAFQVLAAFAIFTGSQWARWLGIVSAGLNALGQLAYVPVYPFWALMMFAVDILIIYALTVYAGKPLRDLRGS